MDSDQKRLGIAAVILAAGGSTRLGSPKQVLLHDGQPLVRRAALAALAAGTDPVIVVVGSDSGLVTSALHDVPSLVIVANDAWQSGQASSLRVGLRAAMAAMADGAVVMLADQPLIESSALARLLSKFDRGHRIVASAYDGTVGAPAIFGVEHFDELMHLTGDSGAGKWLRDQGKIVTTVSLPEAMLDIDTRADAAALL